MDGLHHRYRSSSDIATPNETVSASQFLFSLLRIMNRTNQGVQDLLVSSPDPIYAAAGGLHHCYTMVSDKNIGSGYHFNVS